MVPLTFIVLAARPDVSSPCDGRAVPKIRLMARAANGVIGPMLPRIVALGQDREIRLGRNPPHSFRPDAQRQAVRPITPGLAGSAHAGNGR